MLGTFLGTTYMRPKADITRKSRFLIRVRRAFELNPIRLRPAVGLALIATGASHAQFDSDEPLRSRYSAN